MWKISVSLCRLWKKEEWGLAHSEACLLTTWESIVNLRFLVDRYRSKIQTLARNLEELFKFHHSKHEGLLSLSLCVSHKVFTTCVMRRWWGHQRGQELVRQRLMQVVVLIVPDLSLERNLCLLPQVTRPLNSLRSPRMIKTQNNTKWLKTRSIPTLALSSS